MNGDRRDGERPLGRFVGSGPEPVPVPPPTPPETVFLVDDDSGVLKGISRLLRSAGLSVAAFSSPREFLSALSGPAPGCLVLDVAMPEISGLELQRELAARGCELPVVFLTGRGDVPMCARAMKDGAVDFLTKPVDRDDLLRAVRAALGRDRLARDERAGMATIRARLALLTPREHEVLRHVISGALNKQIASRLGTVEKTIKVHRARVMAKMQAESVAELVRMAERAGVRQA
ncbi:MAG: response regulator [Planctomycetes bacterium]|jgi:FixJ family two-component response regulator|nr:response regulator [Planctomycetota bacterium]